MKLRNLFLLIVGLIFVWALPAEDALLTQECDLILHRMRGTPERVMVDMSKFQPDGTWADVDYQNRTGGAWPTARHLDRAVKLAAYDPDNALKALEAWCRLDPRSPNWWWPCIGVPMRLEDILIRLEVANVPPELLQKIRPLLHVRSGLAMTGQNLIWVAGIRVKEGLLFRDPELVKEGLQTIAKELEIRPPGSEGLQRDFSYHQHGTQLQSGNYGLSFFTEQIAWAKLLQGTRFAYSEAQIGLLERYFMDGLRWTLWDGIMDFSSCGRQLFLREPEAKYRSVLECGNDLLTIVPEEHRKNMATYLKDPQKLFGAKAYPESGYLTYHAPDGWHLSVKMNSSRLAGSESCNQENMRGLYQGDGAMFFGIAKRYQGYPALSDARMIPGTTEILDQRELKPYDYWKRSRNPRGFYAVWADFPVAVAAYRLDTDDLTADKVYFVTPSGITGSGSDVRSDSAFPVVTTIDQYRLDSEADFPVVCHTPKNVPKATRKVEKMQENWKNCFQERRSMPISGEIVRLFIDHGVKPQGASYFYQLRKAQSAVAVSELRLVADSPRIHAIGAEGCVLVAAFVPGTVNLSGGRKIEVKPGITVLDRDGKLLHFEPFRK